MKVRVIANGESKWLVKESNIITKHKNKHLYYGMIMYYHLLLSEPIARDKLKYLTSDFTKLVDKTPCSDLEGDEIRKLNQQEYIEIGNILKKVRMRYNKKLDKLIDKDEDSL